jgi:rhamnosyltransferase
MFKKYKIGKKLIFPAGDMFWARTEAIYQIFEIKFINKFPKELGQLNKTFMHAIERLWLYIIKLNGYYYKTIFKIC